MKSSVDRYDLYRVTDRQCSTCGHWGKVEAFYLYGSSTAPAPFTPTGKDGTIESNCLITNTQHGGSHSCLKWRKKQC